MTQSSLFDVDETVEQLGTLRLLHHEPGTDTQEARTVILLGKAAGYARRLVRLHRRAGAYGLIDDEAGAEMGVAWSTAGATRHAINAKAGRKVFLDSGRRRNTRGGKPAIVWVLDASAVFDESAEQ